VTIFAPDNLTSGSAPGTLTATSGSFTKTLNYEFVATIADGGANTSSVGSIQFINAEPEFMSLKGTGGQGYGETSKVTFKVVDIIGSPIEGAQVDFTLSTTVGGLALSPSRGSSNASGLVTTTVQAGSISTPVRVGASVTLSDGELIFVQSDLLTVTTGIPDQNSVSLSFDKFAPEGLNYDGETVQVTARLGDRFNNPVPDGTVINFTTEGGLIESTCQTVNSVCGVTWTSQSPRPVDHRSTVLAYAIGHETFYDANANGVFDDGDSFDDLGETFRDDDETGTFNPNSGNGFSRDEKLIDYDENGLYSGPDGVYNGVPCEHSTDCPIDANNIANRSNFLTTVNSNTYKTINEESVLVDSAKIIMASSFPNILIRETTGGSCLQPDPDGIYSTNGKLKTDGSCSAGNIAFGPGAETRVLWVLIEDTAALCKTSATGERVDTVSPNDAACTFAIRQSAPTGSSVAVSSEVGDLSASPVSSILNTTGATEFFVTLTSDAENDEVNSGVFEVKVTTPKGNISTASIVVTDPRN